MATLTVPITINTTTVTATFTVGGSSTTGISTIGDVITNATEGSVLFAGASGALAQDNAKLFWDDTNNRLGVGTTTPDASLQIVGDAKFGDDNTNYASFATDGELSLAGTARIVKHIHLNEENFRLGSSSPTEALIGKYPVLQFSNVSTQTIDILFHIPVDWDSTTDMLMHIHWAPVDGNAGDVVWDLDYHVSEPEANEVLSGTTRSLTVTDSTQSLQDEHLKTANVTIPVGDLLPGHIVGMCISRDTGDAADTYASAASFLLAEIIYTANKLGETI